MRQYGCFYMLEREVRTPEWAFGARHAGGMSQGNLPMPTGSAIAKLRAR